MWNRLSTFEYIVRQRHRLDSRDLRKPGPVKEAGLPAVIKEVDSSGTLGYTNPQKDVEQPNTAAVQSDTEFLANGRVRSLSSPVMEEEAPPTVSTGLKTTAHTHRHTQRKKKRKVRRVPAEVTRECYPPAAPHTESTVSLGQRLPLPAFPPRVSLPPLAPPLGPVQAAAPPAEYNSDSAESLEEIPVVLAKLGSSSSAGVGDSISSSRRAILAFPQPSPLPRTKRKDPSSHGNKSSVKLRFEMASAPSVFVSQASGEVTDPGEEVFSLGRTQMGFRPGLGSQSVSRASLSSGPASWMEQ
uniref:Zinc finger, DHHC-type containing 1 n=2 Tax=Iconisemion striatum TaxID=60296 RepID=A0A1A7X2M2_9TELE